MTQTQIDYWRNQETKRHDLATERQAAGELGETTRSHMANEKLTASDIAEKGRHNRVEEGIQKAKTASDIQVNEANIGLTKQKTATEVRNTELTAQKVKTEKATTKKVKAETSNTKQDTKKKKAETSKTQAETKEVKTRTKKEKAETKKVNAETKEVKAKTKKTKAEIPKIQAETGLTHAKTANTVADTQKKKSETGKIEVETDLRRNDLQYYLLKMLNSNDAEFSGTLAGILTLEELVTDPKLKSSHFATAANEVIEKYAAKKEEARKSAKNNAKQTLIHFPNGRVAGYKDRELTQFFSRFYAKDAKGNPKYVWVSHTRSNGKPVVYRVENPDYEKSVNDYHGAIKRTN